MLLNLKKKHQDTVFEMSERIDQLPKMKARIGKDKSQINHETQGVRAATDEIIRAKASSEKSNRNLNGQLNDLKRKVEDVNLTLGDFEDGKRKLAAENGDLLRQVEELENNLILLARAKSQLLNQLDETKKKGR